MILRWPAELGESGRRVTIQNPVELRDVLPTLPEAAQSPVP
jgi:arylsulfatase A-like enzyme